jgi:hypothetical protein
MPGSVVRYRGCPLWACSHERACAGTRQCPRSATPAASVLQCVVIATLYRNVLPYTIPYIVRRRAARRYALLGYAPTGGFLPTMAAQAAAQLAEFGPQELINTVWALAQLGCAPEDAAALLERAPAELLARLESPAQARKVRAGDPRRLPLGAARAVGGEVVGAAGRCRLLVLGALVGKRGRACTRRRSWAWGRWRRRAGRGREVRHRACRRVAGVRRPRALALAPWRLPRRRHRALTFTAATLATCSVVCQQALQGRPGRAR